MSPVPYFRRVGYNADVPDTVLPPPSYSGSVQPASKCAVPGPPLPWGDVKIDYSKLSSTHQPRAKRAVRQAVQDIYYAMMMLEWMDTKGEEQREKVWSKGPFCDEGASLKSFFGDYGKDRVEVLRARLEAMFDVFVQSSPLTISSSSSVVFSKDRHNLALTPEVYGPDLLDVFGAHQIEEAIATAVGVHMPGKYASFLRTRMDAADTCLVSKTQI